MQLFVDHLSNIDCTVLDPEFGLMGASWIVDIVLDGELDTQGMVMDFGDVKKHIKNIIDESLDHTLIVPAKSSNVTVEELGEAYKVRYGFLKGKIEHISPAEAVSFIESDSITIEVLEEYLQETIAESIKDSGLSVEISLREENIAGASYGYSHGLKLHEGNCQRIAHGHRSQIRVLEGKGRSQNLENDWSNRWHGMYLANKDDVKESFEDEGVEYNVFAYSASQGDFELTIPSRCCYLIDNETTVEYLAQHICQTLRQETSKDIKVFAYEGVNKGAIY